MNTDAIFNAAHYAAARIIESDMFVSPNDTVCAIETASGNIFTGVSRANLHAEVDAIQNMLSEGEGIIQGMVLIGTYSRFPLLPCNECVNYILSIAPENANCMVLLSDRMININEVSYYAMPANLPQGYINNMPMGNQQMNNQPVNNQQRFVPVNKIVHNTGPAVQKTEANTENAKSDFLKNKVNSLLDVAKDVETDEFLDSLPTKKKRFGFFKK